MHNFNFIDKKTWSLNDNYITNKNGMENLSIYLALTFLKTNLPSEV